MKILFQKKENRMKETNLKLKRIIIIIVVTIKL